jgi:hypothetical protein
MQTVRALATVRRTQRIVIAALAIAGAVSSLQAQDATYPPQKPSHAKIEDQIILMEESVVQEQWTHTLKLVNAPQSVTLLNPGQCIRIGICATGDNRDAVLEKTKLAFRVQFRGQNEIYPPAFLSEFKQIKLEGGDFVAAALGAAGVKEPDQLKTRASLGASAGHWCVPANASDGPATVEAEVESASGRQVLKTSTIHVESFETGSKKLFKSIEELGEFEQTYYRQPNPARLLPALQFLVADQTQHPRQGQAEIMGAFLTAALKADSVGAQDFQRRIATQPPLTRAFGLVALRSAGYGISGIVGGLSLEERQKFLSLPPLQNPFDLTPTRELFQHLDMMWAVFGATGQVEPVKTVASALSWRADYEDFEKLRKAANHPSVLTPSIVRGVVYTAAGWSLKSFQRNDPLAADYIDYLLASPDTPQSVKLELGALSSNPAFKQQ